MSTREAQTPTNGENLSRTSYRKYSNNSVETNPHSTKNKLRQMFSSIQTTYQIRSISTGMIEMTNKKETSSLGYLLFVEPLVGFEPTTPRLQITCSGQLS